MCHLPGHHRQPPPKSPPARPLAPPAARRTRTTWVRPGKAHRSRARCQHAAAVVVQKALRRRAFGDGPSVREGKHLPGEEAWLIGEWRSSGERKFYLSNQPPRTSLRTLAATIKARWVCEQAHQQLKQDLGLGAFEGRSWTGLHRHAVMACIAVCLPPAPCGSKLSRFGGKKLTTSAPPPRPSLPEVRRAVVERLFKLPPRQHNVRIATEISKRRNRKCQSSAKHDVHRGDERHGSRDPLGSLHRSFAAFCDRASSYGIRIDLEFAPIGAFQILRPLGGSSGRLDAPIPV